jgi:hypothetical protein
VQVVRIRARLNQVEELFLITWFLIAAAFGTWIVREWISRRGRGRR